MARNKLLAKREKKKRIAHVGHSVFNPIKRYGAAALKSNA